MVCTWATGCTCKNICLLSNFFMIYTPFITNWVHGIYKMLRITETKQSLCAKIRINSLINFVFKNPCTFSKRCLLEKVQSGSIITYIRTWHLIIIIRCLHENIKLKRQSTYDITDTQLRHIIINKWWKTYSNNITKWAPNNCILYFKIWDKPCDLAWNNSQPLDTFWPITEFGRPYMLRT